MAKAEVAPAPEVVADPPFTRDHLVAHLNEIAAKSDEGPHATKQRVQRLLSKISNASGDRDPGPEVDAPVSKKGSPDPEKSADKKE